MKNIFQLGIFIFLSLSLMACDEQNLGQPSVATSTPLQTTPTLSASTPEPASEPTIAPPTSPIQASATLLAPQVTAARLTFLGWSPESSLLAYLEHTPEELAINGQFPSGSLKFLNVATGHTCDTSIIFPPGVPHRADQLAWLVDEAILISLNGQILHGTPCQSDFVALTELPTTSNYTIVSHAPDRSRVLLTNQEGYWLYEPGSQAVHQIDEAVQGHSAGYSWSPQNSRLGISAVTDNVNEGFKAATYIVEVATGQLEEVVEYEYRAAEGNLAGPTWLAEDKLLIAETLDRGPLLLTVGQEILPVAPELFGVAAGAGPEGDVTLVARAATIEETNVFHLVLSGVGAEANFPPVRLYHSESGEVEELPFRDVWGPVFSPDGQWLVLGARPIKNGYESYEAWLRPVDPAGAEATLLFSSDHAFSAWSPDWTQVAVEAPEGIVTFPILEGTQSGVWQGIPYTLTPLAWSPNSQFLAVSGYLQQGQEQGLFVIPRTR